MGSKWRTRRYVIPRGGLQTARALSLVVGKNLAGIQENALKYSAQANPPIVEIGGRLDEASCCLWVRNNGIGFDIAYRDRIFEIFRRLHTYAEYPGSSISLALVEKAMERMGGRVWAESAPGEGAVFYIDLQLAKKKKC